MFCQLKHFNKFLTNVQFRKSLEFNSSQFSVAFHIETSHLACKANEVSGFYMKGNTRLKWVKYTFTNKVFNENTLCYTFPTGNYMFKVNNKNSRARWEICSKLTIKTLLVSFWSLYFQPWTYFTPCSSVSIVNFEQENVVMKRLLALKSGAFDHY